MCRLFGRCLGGHGDQPGLNAQLKGSNVDHPLTASFDYDASLPPRCAVEGEGG